MSQICADTVLFLSYSFSSFYFFVWLLLDASGELLVTACIVVVFCALLIKFALLHPVKFFDSLMANGRGNIGYWCADQL
ncbi:hypothetical protein [Sphingobacterium anhuiense]|uniref:Uncharacterized protein n=1 Tax=Sphingobacterium anhuiense TaxID=493780 RepID=A0ABW5YXC4_9SPHI